MAQLYNMKIQLKVIPLKLKFILRYVVTLVALVSFTDNGSNSNFQNADN